jgi:hypothetical protein
MNSNFTTIEQSNRLLELGLPKNSADLYYNKFGALEAIPEYRNFNEFCDSTDTPCWSLGNLIKIYMSCIGSIFLDSSRFVEKESLVDIIISIFEQKIQENQFNFTKLEK